MTIEEVMHPCIHVDKDQRLSHAVELFEKNNIARLPVVDEGVLVGIITQRDVMEKIGHFKEDMKVSTFHISACMTKDPLTLHPSDPVEKAIELFCLHTISGIPVVDEELVGIVTKLDVIETHSYTGKVSAYYTPQFISISAGERVVHTRVLMLENNERCFPVVDRELEGVITTSDVVFGLYKFMKLIDRHQSSLVRNLTVKDVMNRSPETAFLSSHLEDVKTIMVRDNLSTLPVLDDEGAVAGLISKDEMIQVLMLCEKK